jgi:hypothetical protein
MMIGEVLRYRGLYVQTGCAVPPSATAYCPSERLAVLAALALALLALVTAPGPRAAAQGESAVAYIGLYLAVAGADGQWIGYPLGAHPYVRDGSTYAVAMAAMSWDVLQALLGTGNRGSAYLLGDLPYVGDGMCQPGAVRRWWHRGERVAAPLGMDWQAAAPPAMESPPTCPVSEPADGRLELRVVGAAAAP